MTVMKVEKKTPIRTTSHDLGTVPSLEWATLSELGDFVTGIQDKVGTEIAITYSRSDSLFGRTFVLTQAMVDAGSIRKKYYPYTDGDYEFVFKIQRPMEPEEIKAAEEQEAKNDALRLAHERQQFEDLKKKFGQ